MKSVFIIVAVAIVAASGVHAVERDTERVSRTLKLDPGGTLHLKSFSGHVNIRGTDGRDVIIDAVRRAPRERLDHIKLDIHSEGSTVYVDANHRDSWWWATNNNVVETDFEIKVPRRTNIDVNVFSAAVTVEGVEGDYRIGGFSSRVRLDDITGSVKAHTFSGPIEIRTKTWKDNQSIDVDTFSGNVTLQVPESARGMVTFNSFSGHLNSDLPLTLRNGGRRSLKAELGTNAQSGGTLRFKTFSGSVKIDR
jgi:Putative adhesin